MPGLGTNDAADDAISVRAPLGPFFAGSLSGREHAARVLLAATRATPRRAITSRPATAASRTCAGVIKTAATDGRRERSSRTSDHQDEGRDKLQRSTGRCVKKRRPITQKIGFAQARFGAYVRDTTRLQSRRSISDEARHLALRPARADGRERILRLARRRRRVRSTSPSCSTSAASSARACRRERPERHSRSARARNSRRASACRARSKTSRFEALAGVRADRERYDDLAIVTTGRERARGRPRYRCRLAARRTALRSDAAPGATRIDGRRIPVAVSQRVDPQLQHRGRHDGTEPPHSSRSAAPRASRAWITHSGPAACPSTSRRRTCTMRSISLRSRRRS